MDEIDRYQQATSRAELQAKDRTAALSRLFEAPPPGSGDPGRILGQEAIPLIRRFLAGMGSKDGLRWVTYCDGAIGWRGRQKHRVLWAGGAWNIGDASASEHLPDGVYSSGEVILTDEGKIRVMALGSGPGKHGRVTFGGWVLVPVTMQVNTGYPRVKRGFADDDKEQYDRSPLGAVLVRHAQKAGRTL